MCLMLGLLLSVVLVIAVAPSLPTIHSQSNGALNVSENATLNVTVLDSDVDRLWGNIVIWNKTVNTKVYKYSAKINSTYNPDLVVPINGTGGFFGKTIWVNARNNLTLYWNNVTDYIVGDSNNNIVPFETFGGGQNNSVTQLWNTSIYSAVYHLEDATDHTNNSKDGSNAGASLTSCYFGNCYNFTSSANNRFIMHNEIVNVTGNTNYTVLWLAHLNNIGPDLDTDERALVMLNRDGHTEFETQGSHLELFYRTSGGGEAPEVQSGDIINANVWYSMAGTYLTNTDQLRYYMNGSHIINASLDTSIKNPSALVRNHTLGGREEVGGLDEQTDAAIDEVWILNKALTEPEISFWHNTTIQTYEMTIDTTEVNTRFCAFNNVSSGTRVSCTPKLTYNTTYYWFVNITDLTSTTTTPWYNFTTFESSSAENNSKNSGSSVGEEGGQESSGGGGGSSKTNTKGNATQEGNETSSTDQSLSGDGDNPILESISNFFESLFDKVRYFFLRLFLPVSEI